MNEVGSQLSTSNEDKKGKEGDGDETKLTKEIAMHFGQTIVLLLQVTSEKYIIAQKESECCRHDAR